MTWSRLILSLLLAGSAVRVQAQSFGRGDRILLALGDVNLGRQVGQHIFRGDTLFPFRKLDGLLDGADLTFVNLESPLTDQGGETRHPSDVYRFCGPRIAAWTLASAGIDIVSGANNHMYDYGRRGLVETLSSLEEASVRVVGLQADSTSLPDPAVLEAEGIRIGFVAYTEFVNMPGGWKDKIAVFDRRRVRREIRALRKKADLVVASYHGGTEYTERPPGGTLRNMRALAEEGADVVLGHHPHVPQGVEVHGGAVILYSLGNFVFYQPQHVWTQIGLAACVHVEMDGSGAKVTALHLTPFRAGLQPRQDLSSAEFDSVKVRFHATSPAMVRREGSTFIMSTYDHTLF